MMSASKTTSNPDDFSPNTLNSDIRTKTVAKWRCDKCVIRTFDDYDEACRHEDSCTGPPAKKVDAKLPAECSLADEKKSYKSAFLCDVCRVATFDNYVDACRHEESCGGTPSKSGAAKFALPPAADALAVKPVQGSLSGKSPAAEKSLRDEESSCSGPPAKPGDAKVAPPPAEGPLTAKARATGKTLPPLYSVLNPESKWMECIEVPGLVLWDIYAKPRVVFASKPEDNNRVRVSVKALATEFHCPVCLGYMKKPVTVMQCLHRFCSECLEKCLRIGQKECPRCRIHIPSRRSLRQDKHFQAIMRSIYGDVEELKRREEREIEILNRTLNMNNAYSNARTLGIQKQDLLCKGKRLMTESVLSQFSPSSRGRGETVETSGDASATTPQLSSSDSKRQKREYQAPVINDLERSAMINFCVRRHPQETRIDRLNKEVLRTSRDMDLGTLKKFLGKKLSYRFYEDIQILGSVGGAWAVVQEDATTIGELRDEITDIYDAAIMVLQYRVGKDPSD